MQTDIAIDSVMTDIAHSPGLGNGTNLLEAFDKASPKANPGIVSKLRSKLSRSPKLRRFLVTFLVTACLVLGLVLFLKPPIVMKEGTSKGETIKQTAMWVAGAALGAAVLSLVSV
jgi:hypothetical protein